VTVLILCVEAVL